MNPYKSAHAAAPNEQQPAVPATGVVRSWTAFWFTPIDPIGLHAVRLLTGILLIAWLLPFAGRQNALFGLQGWLDLPAYKEVAGLTANITQSVGLTQTFGWSLLYLCGSNPALLTAVYWLSLGVLLLFTLGVWTRLTAVLSWVVVVSFTWNPILNYDADCLLVILTFYLMVGYLLLGQGRQGQSLWSRLLGSRDTLLFGKRSAQREGLKSVGANVALRLLQVHFAIVIVTSGLHKLQFGDWWAGIALWYPLNPPFKATVDSVRAQASDAGFTMTVLSFAAYVTFAWQLGLPFFAWRPRWRPVLLGGAVLGWLGAAYYWEVPLFGPAIFIGCLSYLRPAEWHRLGALLARALPLRRLTGRSPAGQEEHVKQAVKKNEAAPVVGPRHR